MPDQTNQDKNPTRRILSPEIIADYAIKAGFSPSGNVGVVLPSDAAIAVAIALAESGGNIYAHNPTNPDDSFGLWQINMRGNLGPARRQRYGLATNEELYNPMKNALVARQIAGPPYDPFHDKISQAGWRNWTTYTNGIYRVHLATAVDAVKNPQVDDGASHGNPLGGGEPGGSGTNTEVDLLKPLKDLINWVFGLLRPFILRVAGFVGGGVLLVIGIVLYIRWQSR